MSKISQNLSGRRAIILTVVGLLAFILYLRFFVGFDSLFELLSKTSLAQYTIYLGIAITALLIGIVFDSLAWHQLLKALSVKIGFKKVLLYNWVGNFVEMILPCETVCGEVTRVYLAHGESKGDNLGTTAATVATARLLNTAVVLGGLMLGSLSLVVTSQVPSFLVTSLLMVSAGTMAVIAVMLYLALSENAAHRLVRVLMPIIKIVTKNQAKFEQIKEKITEFLTSFGQGFRTFKEHPKTLVEPIILSVLALLCELVAYLMVFYALNFTGISLFDLAIVYSISMTIQNMTAGFPVGAVEISMINLYSIFNVPMVVGGAATTLTRVMTFWFQILVGYPIVQRVGIKRLSGNGIQEN